MSEPLVLVNLFTLPASAVDPFVAGWPASTAGLARAPGFRGTRLHRAVSPEAPYPLVNVARWDSAEPWEAAGSGWRQRGDQDPAGGVTWRVQPALSRVVSETPDPVAAQPSR